MKLGSLCEGSDQPQINKIELKDWLKSPTTDENIIYVYTREWDSGTEQYSIAGWHIDHYVGVVEALTQHEPNTIQSVQGCSSNELPKKYPEYAGIEKFLDPRIDGSTGRKIELYINAWGDLYSNLKHYKNRYMTEDEVYDEIDKFQEWASDIERDFENAGYGDIFWGKYSNARIMHQTIERVIKQWATAAGII